MSTADGDHGHRKEKGGKAKFSEGKVRMESCVCRWVGSGQSWRKEGKGVKKCYSKTERNPSRDQKDKSESARRLIKDEQRKLGEDHEKDGNVSTAGVEVWLGQGRLGFAPTSDHCVGVIWSRPK